jgi:hypothetical protein
MEFQLAFLMVFSTSIIKFKRQECRTFIDWFIADLAQEERDMLMEITRKGSSTAKKVIHSLILLNVDQSGHSETRQTNEEICKILKTGMRTIDRVKKRFVIEGLEAALGIAPTSQIYRKKIDGDAEARLITIACSDPPAGYGRRSNGNSGRRGSTPACVVQKAHIMTAALLIKIKNLFENRLSDKFYYCIFIHLVVPGVVTTNIQHGS